MDTELTVFPDLREDDDVYDAALSLIEDGFAVESAAATLERLRQLDWRHPVLIVYREDGDNRWSYVTLGLNTPELGEGDG